jgi:hypothetical protein
LVQTNTHTRARTLLHFLVLFHLLLLFYIFPAKRGPPESFELKKVDFTFSEFDDLSTVRYIQSHLFRSTIFNWKYLDRWQQSLAQLIQVQETRFQVRTKHASHTRSQKISFGVRGRERNKNGTWDLDVRMS